MLTCAATTWTVRSGWGTVERARGRIDVLKRARRRPMGGPVHQMTPWNERGCGQRCKWRDRHMHLMHD